MCSLTICTGYRADAYPHLNEYADRVFCSFRKLSDALGYMILKPDLWGDARRRRLTGAVPAGFIDQSQEWPEGVDVTAHPSHAAIERWLEDAFANEDTEASQGDNDAPPPYTPGKSFAMAHP